MGMPGAIIGGSLISGAMGSRAASKGAKAQSDASNRSIAEQRRQFDITNQQAAPYRGVGQSALYNLADMMGMSYENPYDQQITDLRAKMAEPKPQSGLDRFRSVIGGSEEQAQPTQGEDGAFGSNIVTTPRDPNDPNLPDEITMNSAGQESTGNPELDALLGKQKAFNEREKYDFTATPGYEFRLGEGQKGLERSQIGRRLSGRALKESMRYGQEYASGEFANQFSRLSSLAGFGPSMVGAGMPTGIPGTMEAAGRAQAQGSMNQYGAVNNAVQGGLSNYMTSQYMNYNNAPIGGGSGVAGDAYMPAYQG